MADTAPSLTAWDAALAGTRSLRGYAQLALNAGLIRCAAAGHLRSRGGTDVVASIGSSLAVFAADGSGMTLEYVCGAPIFANVLSVVCVPAGGTLTAEGPADAWLVLTECGMLALGSVEDTGGCVRLRLAEQSRVVTEGHGRAGPRLLRKLVVDPLARAVAAVSWLDHIEVAVLGPGGSAGPRLDGGRQHIRAGGAICDATFLAPSPSESHRILLVAAVMDGQRQSVGLHLYETWAHAADEDPVLVAKLPLPFDMATPVHLVPLPALPEHFLLLTEGEAVLGSAFQLLSGDIHLHRQPLPQREGSGGSSDIARAVCVAGTMPIPDSAASEDPQASRAPLRSPRPWQHSPAAQKVFVAMQSGALLRVCVAPRPFITVERVTPTDAPRLLLGDVLLPLDRGPEIADGASASDILFASGDGTDHAIVHIAEPAACSDEGAGQTSGAPAMRARTVLANHSPAVDCVLERGAMLTTSGRAPHGAVRETQLGHAAWLGGVLVEGGEGGPDAEAPPVTQAWSLALRTPAGAAAPCVVLQHAGAAMAAVEDADGSWRVHEALRRAVADRHLVFVGACGRGDNGASRVLCVFEDSAQIADIGVDAQQALAQTRQLAAAPADCSITHGACATTRAGCAWAVVAVQPTRGANPQAAASEGRPRATLRAIRVAGSGGGDDAASVDLEHSVSCLRAFAVGEHVLVVAGTYEPGVCVYRIDGDSTPAALAPCGLDLPLPELLLPYGRGDDMGVDDAPACPDAAAVSDVYVLTAPSRSFVLAGLRNGLLAWTAMPAGAPAAAGDLPSASAPTVVEAGTAPIVFSGVQPPVRDHALPDPPADDASRALICAGSLYVARIGDQSQLEMAPCAGEDRMPQPICKVLPLAAAATASDSAGAWRFLMVSGQGCAAVAAVATRAQGSFRELRVEGMPRRIVRDRDTGLLLVASAVPPATACLSALDPVSGQVRARVQFLPSERVCALATWYVQGPKLYRYVCVGTAQQAEQQATGGRLVIFSLKPARRRGRARPTLPEAPDAAGGCELKYVWESARGGPVAAVASMGDAYLVVAAGASCAVLRLDVARKQVVECCSCALRFPVTSLDVDGHDIAAGSEREAVSLLRFTPGDGGDCLELRHSARFGVCAADARFLAPGLVAGVDRSGYVFVMGIPDGPSEFALDFALGFHLGVESTRLRVGCAVRRLGPVPHVLPWSDPPAAAPNTRPPPCLVVTAVDGAVWAVARITDDAFALLRLLEQAMLHMPLGHPARPLLAANGTANRARGPARIPPANVIDGTLAAVFAGALTETEQGQVVDSSPDLTRLAREMAARRSELGSGSATAAAARFIGGVVRTLARTGSC